MKLPGSFGKGVTRLTENCLIYSPYLGKDVLVKNFDTKRLRAHIEKLKNKQIDASDKDWHILQANVDACEWILALKCQRVGDQHDKL